jgi:rSAM/selenodomain-associated transferase 1
MPADAQRCAIAVMAKAPRVGAAKTRLMPALSAEEAAALSACFIRDAAANIAAASREAAIDGYIAYAPADAEGEFRTLVGDGIGLLPSRRFGLAASLYDGARDLLAAGYGSACLLNSDSPTLPTAILLDAAKLLSQPGDRVVLGPAEDGGYYLIGLKQAHARLFEEIAWSTPSVFAQTVMRARELGLEPAILPSWYDVDDLNSLRRLTAELLAPVESSGRVPFAAPHTAAFLRALGVGAGDDIRRGCIDPSGP